MTSYYLDIHALQSVPPSNVNRDDTGAPKTAMYGGVRRARVSSQAWKKAVREAFKDFIDPDQRGKRTLRVVELLMERMMIIAPHLSADQAKERAIKVVNALGLKTEKPRSKDKDTDPIERSQYLVFYSHHQLNRLAELAANADGAVSKIEAKTAADSDHGIEVGLFGRMVADSKDLNVDSAVQVAHALSTHAVETESDYYTAVDDKLDDDDSGAGMIGNIEFNSSTLYRFATVDLSELLRSLEDLPLTAEAATAFVKGFIISMPTGKQNTFANNTLPDGVLVQLRKGRSASFVGAFETPVVSRNGYMAASCKALAEHVADVQKNFLDEPIASWVVRSGLHSAPLAALGTELPLRDALNSIRETVTNALSGEASS